MFFQSTSFRQTNLMWTQGPQALRDVGMVTISWQKNISSKHSLSAHPLGQVLESQLLPGDGAFVYLCMWKAMGSCTQYGYYRTGLLKVQPGGLMMWIIGCLTEVLASGLAIIFLQMWSFVSLWPNVIWWNEHRCLSCNGDKAKGKKRKAGHWVKFNKMQYIYRRPIYYCLSTWNVPHGDLPTPTYTQSQKKKCESLIPRARICDQRVFADMIKSWVWRWEHSGWDI